MADVSLPKSNSVVTTKLTKGLDPNLEINTLRIRPNKPPLAKRPHSHRNNFRTKVNIADSHPIIQQDTGIYKVPETLLYTNLNYCKADAIVNNKASPELDCNVANLWHKTKVGLNKFDSRTSSRTHDKTKSSSRSGRNKDLRVQKTDSPNADSTNMSSSNLVDTELSQVSSNKNLTSSKDEPVVENATLELSPGRRGREIYKPNGTITPEPLIEKVDSLETSSSHDVSEQYSRSGDAARINGNLDACEYIDDTDDESSEGVGSLTDAQKAAVHTFLLTRVAELERDIQARTPNRNMATSTIEMESGQVDTTPFWEYCTARDIGITTAQLNAEQLKKANIQLKDSVHSTDYDPTLYTKQTATISTVDKSVFTSIENDSPGRITPQDQFKKEDNDCNTKHNLNTKNDLNNDHSSGAETNIRQPPILTQTNLTQTKWTPEIAYMEETFAKGRKILFFLFFLFFFISYITSTYSSNYQVGLQYYLVALFIQFLLFGIYQRDYKFSKFLCETCPNLFSKIREKFVLIISTIYYFFFSSPFDREAEWQKIMEQQKLIEAVRPAMIKQRYQLRLNELKNKRLPDFVKKFAKRAKNLTTSHAFFNSEKGGEEDAYSHFGNTEYSASEFLPKSSLSAKHSQPPLIWIEDEYEDCLIKDDPHTGCKLMTEILINDSVVAKAQIDSGAQIAVMSLEFFNKLSRESTQKIRFQPSQSLKVNGLGGSVDILDQPVLIQLQIGNLVMNHRVIVTPNLKGTDLLLGLDLLTSKKLTIGPRADGRMVLSRWNEKEKSLTEVQMEIAKNINWLQLSKEETIKAGETKFVHIEIDKLDTQCQSWLNNTPLLIKNYKDPETDNIIEVPAEFIQQPDRGRISIPIRSKSSQDITLPEGWVIAEAKSFIENDLLVTKNGSYQINNLGTNTTVTDRDSVDILLNSKEQTDILNDVTDHLIASDEDHSQKPKTRDKLKDVQTKDSEPVKRFSFTPDPVEEGMDEEGFEPPGFDHPSFQSDEYSKLLTNEDIPLRFRQPLVDFIKKYTPNVVSTSEWDIGETDLITHDIPTTTDEPVYLKPYKVQSFRLDQLREAINELIKIGVLKQGDSQYAFPCFWISKKQDSGSTAQRMRLIFDLRGLNEISLRQNFPLGDITHLMAKVQGSKYFIALDVRHAYYSIKLTEEASKKCSIITPEGVYNSLRLVFGLSGAPATFSRLMSKVLDGSKAIFYMDDILIHSDSEEELFEILKDTLARLNTAGLKIIPSKAVFWARELSWLGSILDGRGKRPDPKKIQAIKNFTTLSSVKQAQSFLGMLAYQCAYIANFSQVIAPISDLIKKHAEFKMTPEAQQAFEDIKNTITDKTMLYHPNFNEELYASSDASHIGAGGWLYQVSIYENTLEGRQKAAEDWNLSPDWKSPKSYFGQPGKGTPGPINIQKDPPTIKLGDKTPSTTSKNISVPKEEKVEVETVAEAVTSPKEQEVDDISKNKPNNTNKQKEVYVIKPIAFWSKKFSETQKKSWGSLEKEFSACLQLVMQFADYFVACTKPVYLCVDSQPLLWACKFSSGPAAKLIRWAYLFQTYCPAEIIITHCSGPKLGTADFLSRVWVVPKRADLLNPKKAVHITPTFAPGAIITYNDIIQALDDDPHIVQESQGQNVMLKSKLRENTTQTPKWECESHDELHNNKCSTKIDKKIFNAVLSTAQVR